MNDEVKKPRPSGRGAVTTEPRETTRDWLFGEPHPGIDRIARLIAARCDLTVSDLCSAKRRRKYSRARHAAMYLAYKTLDKSATQIGRFFNRDHTTVLYAIRAVESAPHLYPIECDIGV